MLTVTVVAAVGVTTAVDRPQPEAVAPATVHTSETGAANPASGVMVAVVLVPSPATTLPDVGLRLIVKSTPFPVSVALKPE